MLQAVCAKQISFNFNCASAGQCTGPNLHLSSYKLLVNVQNPVMRGAFLSV